MHNNINQSSIQKLLYHIKVKQADCEHDLRPENHLNQRDYQSLCLLHLKNNHLRVIIIFVFRYFITVRSLVKYPFGISWPCIITQPFLDQKRSEACIEFRPGPDLFHFVSNRWRFIPKQDLIVVKSSDPRINLIVVLK